MIHIAKNHWVYRDMSRFSTDSGKARNYLEIGPGDGALMSAFASDGWVCHAVGPGNWLGGDGIVSSAEGLPRELRVNTLVLHDVLEHCADPAETLGEYSKFLDIGGRVYLAFPNSDSLEARWYGPSWGMVLPFGHLNYFSYKSIEKLLERSGLQLESAHHARLGRRSEALKSLLRRPLRAVVRGIRKQSWSEFVRNLRLGLNDLISLVSKGDQWHIIAVHKNNSQ
jgi:hypothetical protein